MKVTLKRVNKLAIVTVSAAMIWSLGLWSGTRQAFAQHFINGFGSGLAQYTYFDVATSFVKSQSGYGGQGSSGGYGDALVRVTNMGNFEANPSTGILCANIYVFNDVFNSGPGFGPGGPGMEECCSCPIGALGLVTFSTINDLTRNPLDNKSSLSAGVIEIVGSTGLDPNKCTSQTAGSLSRTDLAAGLTAWVNHAEAIASNDPSKNYGFFTSASVAQFADVALDSFELAILDPTCSNIQSQGGGKGICTCGIGS
jgi:hypothetical protein